MQSSPARRRVEQEAARRGNAAVVVSTLLSLLVVVAAVAVVAYLVLRTPSPAVDSAERLDPVGTALPAPTEPPTLPTLVPTTEPGSETEAVTETDADSEAEPEPTALGFTGDAPEVAGLPTVTAPEENAGPTPTPRVIAQPTAAPPPTALPPAPTLPPSVPVTQVPVVALEPVESAPPPTSEPAPTRVVSEPTPVPDADEDDDPFNIFDDDPRSRADGIENEALARVREMQEERDAGRSISVPTFAPGSERRRDDSADEEAIDFPDRNADDEPDIIASRDEPRGNAMPDVDAMIDEITARATNPDRDRDDNDRDRGRRITDRGDDDDDDDDEDNDDEDTDRRRHRSPREIVDDRLGRDSDSRVIFPRGQDDQPCTDPTAEGFPFNC